MSQLGSRTAQQITPESSSLALMLWRLMFGDGNPDHWDFGDFDGPFLSRISIISADCDDQNMGLMMINGFRMDKGGMIIPSFGIPLKKKIFIGGWPSPRYIQLLSMAHLVISCNFGYHGQSIHVNPCQPPLYLLPTQSKTASQHKLNSSILTASSRETQRVWKPTSPPASI